jgi:methanogenic corrinoid protein MtbC1
MDTMNAHHNTQGWSHHLAKRKFEHFFQQANWDKGHTADIKNLIQFSLKKKIPLSMVSTDVLDRAMHISIKKFDRGDYYVPQLVRKAKTIGDARAMLADHDYGMKSMNKGKFLITTVEGECHSQGKIFVTSLLRGIGFKTIDLGLGVAVKDIINAVKWHKPDYIGVSVSTLALIPKVKMLKNKLEKKVGLKKTKVIIGGYVAMDESSETIGAEHYCKNITHTISLLKTLASEGDDMQFTQIR